MSNKEKVQAQFGTETATQGYATSAIHAKGESLEILTGLISPQPHWRMLDVATGAGHTALAFASKVAEVIATDITEAMLKTAARLAAERGLSNFQTKLADAEALPFDDNSFNLLTCRLAFHHFPQPRQALAEFARVLKPGGTLGFTDNFIIADEQAVEYYNAYEKLRDPSHHWILPLAELKAMMTAAGLKIGPIRKLTKEFEFHQWADRQSVSVADKEKLLEMMRNIPAALQPHFRPRWEDGTMYFTLREAVIVACMA